MSNDYFILNLLNIKDKNITFNGGIHRRKIKGITYKVVSAKLAYSKNFCPHFKGSNIINYGSKSSSVKFSSSGSYPILIDLRIR